MNQSDRELLSALHEAASVPGWGPGGGTQSAAFSGAIAYANGGKHHGAGFRVIGIHGTEAEAIIAAFEALP